MSPSSVQRMPVLFVSHGGGPWPFVAGLRELYAQTEQQLRALPGRISSRPNAVLVVSGHWEATNFSVATAAQPRMEYDYSGFPAHTYAIQYPAPGAPALARRALELLGSAGIRAEANALSGFDHGVFVPLSLMYPDADMPVLTVSLKSGYSTADHLAMGRALSALRDEGVLIIGSGLTYHNMRGFGRPESTPIAEAFTRFLDESVTSPSESERSERLLKWETAPMARQAHPQEDHLMPLIVAAGAAQEDIGRVLFTEKIYEVPMTSYVFGSLASS